MGRVRKKPVRRKRKHASRYILVGILLSHILCIVSGYITAHWIGDYTKLGAPGKGLYTLSSSGSPGTLLARYEETLFRQTQDLVLERKTIEMLRAENIELQDRVNKMAKEIELFKRVIRGHNDANGLAFGTLTLVPSGSQNYKLAIEVVQMSGTNRVQGELTITIEGYDAKKKGRFSTLPLHLGNTADDRAYPLDFSNFQKIDVAVRLPSGFNPQNVLVEAHFDKGKKAKILKRYDWQITK